MGHRSRRKIGFQQAKKRRAKRARMKAKGLNPDDFYIGKTWVGAKKNAEK